MNILGLWNSFSRIPLIGRRLFHLLLYIRVPYTGSISPRVLELTAGRARVQVKDTKRIRNHLNSVHAIALANLGEAASGLALITAIPKTSRAILVKFEIEYLKKARGTLVANCTIDPATFAAASSDRKNYEITAPILDAKQEIVAKVKATWLVGPSGG